MTPHTLDDKKLEGHLEEVGAVLGLLEEYGSESRFLWFREIDRRTGIDRGLLRNILNHLKKTREIREMHGQNKRIFFALKKYYGQCRDAESRSKDGTVPDGYSRARGLSRTQKSADRTRKRIERQQKRREVKLFSRARHKRRAGLPSPHRGVKK